VDNDAASAENVQQSRAQEPPVEREALEDWLARHPAYGAVTLPAIDHDGVERVGEHAAGITANRWTGYYAPDLDKLSPGRLAELKADAVGQYLGKHYQVEGLLAAYELSFGGIPFLRHWEAMKVDDRVPCVAPKDERALCLLLGLAWMCSLPRARDAETERAVSTVLNANDAFRAAHKLRSKGGKAPRTTSQGEATRGEVLRRYHALGIPTSQRPSVPERNRANRVFKGMAKDWQEGMPWRPVSRETIRKIIRESVPSKKSGT
jgi:hypothetical protein